MPLPPASPNGVPSTSTAEVVYDPTTILQSATTEVLVADRTGYLTSARVIPVAAVTGAASPASRSLLIVDPTTRAITDGIVAVSGTAASKGPWASGTFSVGDIVTYNNITYVCIASATTQAPTDTTKWQPVSALGLDVLTSRTAAFTKDDVDKTISGTGFTSAKITAFVDATTVKVTANSAIQNALSVTIGASRTLATLALLSGVNLVADAPSALTLSATDTKVYKGDVLQIQSNAVGGTGLADTGGGLVQLEITDYAEGSD